NVHLAGVGREIRPMPKSSTPLEPVYCVVNWTFATSAFCARATGAANAHSSIATVSAKTHRTDRSDQMLASETTGLTRAREFAGVLGAGHEQAVSVGCSDS